MPVSRSPTETGCAVELSGGMREARPVDTVDPNLGVGDGIGPVPAGPFLCLNMEFSDQFLVEFPS